jgi:XTP/dITP diphosphohydrolase
MIPPRVVLATANPGKVRELQELLADWDMAEVVSLAAFPGVGCPPETGVTYVENAVRKARAVSEATGLPALGDDSGLEVDALGGRPGVYSARYAGPSATDAERIETLLGELVGVSIERRTARFRCVVALASPDGRVETAEGVCAGRIAHAAVGSNGFGYDPIFVADELGVTCAAASAADKSRVSHRGRAVRALRDLLRRS